MEIFEINKFLKHLIIKNPNMGLTKRLELINGLRLPKLTSLQTLKVIEGIENYGTLLDIDDLLKLPNLNCRKLNTSIQLILNHYMEFDEEELRENINLLLNINIDKTIGGFNEGDLNVSVQGVRDILQDYVIGSRTNQTKKQKLGENEISLYSIKVDYKDLEMIREFEPGCEIFN